MATDGSAVIGNVYTGISIASLGIPVIAAGSVLHELNRLEQPARRRRRQKERKCPYSHSTIRRGKVKVTSLRQHRFLEATKLPHTHVYVCPNSTTQRKRVHVDKKKRKR